MRRKGVFTLIIHKFTSSYSRISRQKKISHFFQLLFKFMLVQKNSTQVGSTDRRQLSDLAVFARLLVECRAIASRRVLLLLQIFGIFARTKKSELKS